MWENHLVSMIDYSDMFGFLIFFINNIVEIKKKFIQLRKIIVDYTINDEQVFVLDKKSPIIKFFVIDYKKLMIGVVRC